MTNESLAYHGRQIEIAFRKRAAMCRTAEANYRGIAGIEDGPSQSEMMAFADLWRHAAMLDEQLADHPCLHRHRVTDQPFSDGCLWGSK